MISKKIESVIMYIIGSVFWSAVIVFFLYIPTFFNAFVEQKQLNILAFPQIIDKEYLKDFEQTNGITVNITYFESSEDLLTKLYNTPEHGYDLFMISDLFVPTLIQKGLIKKIDKRKLTFFQDYFPALLNHPFDPQNQYTLPCFWSVYGIGVDLNYFGTMPVIDWSFIFQKPYLFNQVGMLEDVRELFAIAAYYLFKKRADLTSQELQETLQLLIEQKKWVAIYTDMRSEYVLAAKTAPVVLSSNSDIAKVARHYPQMQFVVPHEGSFVKIDSYVVAASTTQDEQVYALLNYLHEPAVMQQYVDKFQFFPTIHHITYPEVLPGYSVPTAELFAQLNFFNPQLLSSKIAEKAWISIKAS